MSGAALISVLMPVHNREAYVADAIRSILLQSHARFELIVVDDHSSDGSMARVRALQQADNRIRIVPNAGRGVAAARNTAVAQAQGEYLAWMDSDDLAEPDRLTAQLQWLQQQRLDICGSWALRFGRTDGVLDFPPDQRSIEIEMLFRAAMLQPSLLLRAEVARQLPYTDQLEFEDYEWLTRAVPRYRVGNLPQPKLRWRMHAGQTHAERAVAFVRTLESARFGYAARLMPDLFPTDYLALARLTACSPPADAAELLNCGQLLVRLAAEVDDSTRRRMAGRWQGHFDRHSQACGALDSELQCLFDACLEQINPGSTTHA